MNSNPLRNIEPTVIKIYSDNCAPCKAMAVVFENLAAKTQGVEFLSLNGPDNMDVMKEVGFRRVPAFVFVKDGQIKGKFLGATTEDHLEKMIQEFLG